MTREQKKNLQETFVKWVPATITPLSLIALIMLGARFITKMENLTFDSPEQKTRIIDKYEQLPSPLDTYVATKNVETIGIKLLENRKLDSIKQSEMDTLIKRNTFTIYQMKEEQKKQNIKQEKTLQAILDKLD